MTDDAPTPREDASILAAEYVLGLLPAAERQAFANRLAGEPRLAELVRYWEEHLVQIADAVEPVAPARQVFNMIERRLFAETAQPRAALWNSLVFWRGLATAAIVGLVALGAWNLRPTAPVESQAMVAQLAGDQSQIRLLAYYDRSSGELRLNRTAGAAATGRSLELWLISGTDAPVSLGVLPAETTSRSIVPAALRDKFADATLAISDEPPGGSSTGAPTGAVLATGKLSQI
jgi:anti-sigma-K factor RskA